MPPSVIENFLNGCWAFCGAVVFSPHPAGTDGRTRRGTMAGTGQGLFVGVAVLGMVSLGWAAAADPIPLPTPAPLPKEGAASPSRSGTTAQSGRIRSLFHLDKEPETAPTPATTTTGFTAAQRA